jgi:Na+/H+ antiporter NhaB
MLAIVTQSGTNIAGVATSDGQAGCLLFLT